MKNDKSLKDKAIDIKGKLYVNVSERVIYFNDNYPTGSILTELLSEPTAKLIVIRATVMPDIESTRQFIGHAQEEIGVGYINKTSAMENAETSAVGRALGMMGIGVIESIASVDEIRKAENRSVGSSNVSTKRVKKVSNKISVNQKIAIKKLLEKEGHTLIKGKLERMSDLLEMLVTDVNELSIKQASTIIAKIQGSELAERNLGVKEKNFPKEEDLPKGLQQPKVLDDVDKGLL